MAESQLCWKCENATDCKKCPFVARLTKFYIRQKGQDIIIKDLSRYYIKGTKLDNKGNIISCPLFVPDNLDHRTKTEKLNDFANENNLSVNGVFIQKYEVLNKFKKDMQAMSEEEKKRRQNEFKERVKAKYEQLEKIEKGKAEDKEQKQQTEKTGKSKTEKKGLKQNVTKKIKPLSKNAKKRIISELQIKLQEKDFDKAKILIANIKDIELQTYCQDLYLFEKIKQLAKENNFENAFNILENISNEDIKENAISNICDKFLYQVKALMKNI